MNQVKNVVEHCKLVNPTKYVKQCFSRLVVFLMLPVDGLLRTNVKGNLVSNPKTICGYKCCSYMLAVICLYFNNDVLNLVLLYTCVCRKL